LRLVDQPTLRLMFGGSDAEDETINYNVDLWYCVNGATGMAYVPVTVCSGVATLGAETYGTGGANLGSATANYFADTITAAVLGDGGVGVHQSIVADGIAWLEIDLQNAIGVQVRTDLGTAAGADVFAQLGEASIAGANAAGSVLRLAYAAADFALSTNEIA